MTDERALYDMFHETLDRVDVSGPFQRLQIEIEKPGAARRPRGRRIFMTRNRLVLLAAAMVLLLGVAVLVSERALSGTKGVGSNVNAGQDYRISVAQLLSSRPLTLPRLKATDPCPDGPYTGTLYGAGPVIGNGNGPDNNAWGSYWDIFFDIPIGQKGPVVARAEDLRTGVPVVFLGPYGVGDPYGTDVYHGKTQVQFTAVAFDTAHPPTRIQLNNPKGAFGEWTLTDGIKAGWTGCFGYQIDLPDFTETFYTAEPRIS